jgi:hypothetical protein
MTVKKDYEIINNILWGLKPFEIVATLSIIISLVLLAFGDISIWVIAYALFSRFILFVLRLAIINVKRNMEKEHSELSVYRKQQLSKKYQF